MSHQCQECKKWSECRGAPEWFPPVVIRYCPSQVRWLLAHLYFIAQGYWPREGVETGYYDMAFMLKRYGNAYFVIPVTITADMNLRLDRCGRDGNLARRVLCNGWDKKEVAELKGVDVYEVQRRVNRVIAYISGVREKIRTYDEFKERYSPRYGR